MNKLAMFLAALFPTTWKAVTDTADADTVTAFEAEAQTVADKLEAAEAALAAKQEELAAANGKLADLQKLLEAESAESQRLAALLADEQAARVSLQEKADAWDAYKAALDGSVPVQRSNNPAKHEGETRNERIQRVKAEFGAYFEL